MAEGVIYRVCTAEDAPQLQSLWKLVFGDTDSFLAFYFAHRFVPAYSVCTELDGNIVGGIFGLPCTMNLRGVGVKASMSSGFCTHPDHRGKGYFSNLYALYLHVLRENGVVLAPNTPVYHDAYFRFDTYSATNSRYLTGTCPTYLSPKCKLIDGLQFTDQLLACYNRNMADFSAAICRSYADFQLRLADCASDGAKILAIFEKKRVVAYAIYFANHEKLLTIEVIADNENLLGTLLYGLAFEADGRELEIKLPPNSKANLSHLTESIRPQGVCALVNAPRLLALVGKDLPISIQITDVIVPENRGIFNFSGESITTLPTASLSGGHLLQGILGYRTFSQLAKDGTMVVYDHNIIPILNRYFPAQDCYVLEEY